MEKINNPGYKYNIDFNYYKNVDFKENEILIPRGNLQFDIIENENTVNPEQLFIELIIFCKNALEAMFDTEITLH